MSSAHTPGPWYWADNVPEAPPTYCAIVDSAGFTIADPSPMSEADARLIAAAPELLAALRWALDQIEDDLDFDHQAALEAAKAAISKATGGAL